MQRAVAAPSSACLRFAWPLLLAALGAGCAGQPLPAKVREAPALGEATGPAFVTPAHWDYHPPAPDTALASIRLADGGCVFTAEGGQRWRSTPAKGGPAQGAPGRCTGKAEAS